MLQWVTLRFNSFMYSDKEKCWHCKALWISVWDALKVIQYHFTFDDVSSFFARDGAQPCPADSVITADQGSCYQILTE